MISNEARLRVIEKRLEHLRTFNSGRGSTGGNGKPYATIVVAAHDSQATNAANADYVCNGVNDEEEISVALVTGRRVLLLDGHFVLSGPILAISNFDLNGMGIGVTDVACPANYHVYAEDIDHVTISNITFSAAGDGITLLTADDTTIRDCEFANLNIAIKLVGCQKTIVAGNRFLGCGIQVN